MILAIETSCDETSVAVIHNGQILSNELYSQIKQHKAFGGVVPELASRLHCEFIDVILDRALRHAGITLSDVSKIAVTVGPGLEGALLVGVTAAAALSQQLDVPLYGVNHLHGHIFAAKAAGKIQYPSLVCIASGGHTMVVKMDSAMDLDVVCNTMDDACGEAFDKVARMLDLGYPGGPKVEALAKDGKANIQFPHPVKKKWNAFSFSGLKTAVKTQIAGSDATEFPDIAASFQHTVAVILESKLAHFIQEYNTKQVILCGGVFANQTIRQHLIDTLSLDDILIPELKLCTDNAAMIGLACEELINAGGSPIKVPFCMPQLGLRFAHS